MISIILALTLLPSLAFTQEESDFYKETIHKLSLVKDLKLDYNVDGKGNDLDSKKLQKAIDEVNEAGGGSIFVPEGIYKLASIMMKSNVHLKFDYRATVIPITVNPKKSTKIFILDGGISNVSIRGIGGKFPIELFNYEKGIVVFGCRNVNNFMISDFIVHDSKTKFSCINFNIHEVSNGEYDRLKNGLIKNGDVKNAHYGYGLVQIQAAENLLFKDVSGTGGVTLRIETGAKMMNNLEQGGVDKIFGRNISCIDGNAALMVSPHSMHNGIVKVDGVTSINCGFAVRIGNGYVAKKYSNPNLTAGTFKKVSIKNVHAAFGITAQLKPKHYKYIPKYREHLKTKISDDNNTTFIGPSIAAVLNGSDNYSEVVSIENVSHTGFLCQKPILTSVDTHSVMDCEKVN